MNGVDSKSLTELDRDGNSQDNHGLITFSPPLYMQRYSKVLEILSRTKPKKVADFGCAECKLIQLLKSENYIEELCGVDIDEGILDCSRRKIEPLTTDYIKPRTRPLVVKLLHGSILTKINLLQCYEAVTCIEVIEHLYPSQLPHFCESIFGFIRPRTVVISTPNADFNILFSPTFKLRHWDHKFEWTRKEFQSWCLDVCSQYDYCVDFDGVGEAPEKADDLGFCSQFAIFSRSLTAPERIVCQLNGTNCPCKVVASSTHPYRTEEEKLEDDILSCMRSSVSYIVTACKAALQTHNDNLCKYYESNDSQKDYAYSVEGYYTVESPNQTVQFIQMNFCPEEDQFRDAEGENCDVKDSVNTYGQETHSVVVEPCVISLVQKIREKFRLYSKSFYEIGQFDDAFEVIPNNNRSTETCEFLELSQFNDELSCSVKLTEKSFLPNRGDKKYITFYVYDNMLHIPMQIILNLPSIQKLKCDPSLIRNVMKQKSTDGIFVSEETDFLEVDIDLENEYSSDKGYSDTSSNNQDFQFEYINEEQSCDTFSEENWDLDSAYNEEKSSPDPNTSEQVQ